MSNSTNFQINNKRTENSWAMFDWANSAFALVITTAIFPAYFNVTTSYDLNIFGIETTRTALFSYIIAIGYTVICCALPFLSGIADYGGKRLSFMKFFTFMGALACICLFGFSGMDTLAIGIIGYVIALIGFAGGQVFYNSYLPLIVSEDQYDRVSAKGFSYGFIGSAILLCFNLMMIQKPEWFGFDALVANYPELLGTNAQTFATRLSFVTVGLWWFGFAQIPFRRLPKDSKVPFNMGIMKKGLQELKKVWRQVKVEKNIKRFLFSFFFYMAGSQTVLMLASTFANQELNFGTSELIQIILLLQILGAFGAWGFAKLSSRLGNKLTISIILVIWIVVCISAFFVYAKILFYPLAAGVGLVMGGIQSMSRSTYSKLIPEDTEDTTSFFSFYDVLEKSAIVLGTLSFGLIDQLTGGMRNSILALVVFFVIGFLILTTVKIRKTA